MGEYFLGEVRLVSFNFAPRNWALCNGQLLPVNQNQALFSLLGVTYGGDGVTTFGLPDLRGRVPVHVSQDTPRGGAGGEAQHTLTIAEMPGHLHMLFADATNAADNNSNIPAGGNSLGASVSHSNQGDTALNIYNSALTSPVPVASGMVGNNGGGQAHENRQPFQVISACICLNGIFPSRN